MPQCFIQSLELNCPVLALPPVGILRETFKLENEIASSANKLLSSQS